MNIFYTPQIAQNKELPEDESTHCVRVLRMVEGDEMMLTDGVGTFYKAVITHAHAKRCAVEVVETLPSPNHWPAEVHIAIAPTKNMDRIEWFAEKCTEIGIDSITLLRCRHSERKEIKVPRMEKILVSAMKQSLKATLPRITEMTDFARFVKQPFDGQKFIAHCNDDENKLSLKQRYQLGQNALVLIGPEGDFSPQEVEMALENGFLPITLGDSRLRTETAGVVACHTIQLLNQE